MAESQKRTQTDRPFHLVRPSTPDFDDEYFAQLAAEKLVTKVRGSRPVQEWVQTRPRNEALDCLVGNFAMMRLSGKDLDADPAPQRRNPTEKTETWPPRPVAGVVARHGRGVSRR